MQVGEEPEGVTVRPDGAVVYVTCEETGEVVAVDTATLKVLAHIKTGARPRAVIFTTDSACRLRDEREQRHRQRVRRQDAPCDIHDQDSAAQEQHDSAASDGRGRCHPTVDGSTSASGVPQAVGVIDTTTRTFSRLIENVGQRVWGVAISPDGRTLYTANGPGADVSVVDIESGTVKQRIATGGSPWGVAIARRR